MAAIIILSGDWKLSDGILSPILLREIADVRGALTDAGYISDHPVGLGALEGEWVNNRTWTYETAFDMPGDDERAVLACAYMAGRGRVILNGRETLAFEAGALQADISGDVLPGRNALQIAFEPCARDLIGLPDAPRLVTGNCLTVQRAFAAGVIENGDGQIDVSLWLNAHTSGWYTFKYVFSAGDEPAGDCLYTERLRVGCAQIAHRLTIRGAVSFDRTEDTVYGVRLCVERAGVSCAQQFFRMALCERGARATRVCRLQPCGRAALENRLVELHELGVDGVLYEGGEISPDEGFLPVVDAPPSPIAYPALKRVEDMRRMAGDEQCWPPDCVVWRLTGSLAPDEQAFLRLFGVNALGDAGRAARLSRYLQAEYVRAAALRARANGQVALIENVFENAPRYAGTQLVETGGRRRPAYYALKDAWANVAVYAELPPEGSLKPGASLVIPLFAVSSGDARSDAMTVKAACFDHRGTPLSGVSYPVLTQNEGPVGTLCVALPDSEQALIVRVEAVDEENRIIARWDGILCVTDGPYPLAPLMNLPAANVRVENGQAVNGGDEVAFAATGNAYRALLPGEQMPCAETFECLNTF